MPVDDDNDNPHAANTDDDDDSDDGDGIDDGDSGDSHQSDGDNNGDDDCDDGVGGDDDNDADDYNSGDDQGRDRSEWSTKHLLSHRLVFTSSILLSRILQTYMCIFDWLVLVRAQEGPGTECSLFAKRQCNKPDNPAETS